MSRIAFLTLLSLPLMLALASCGSAPEVSAGGPGLRVVDALGHELPAGAARVEASTDGYSVYALDAAAAGFSLSYNSALRVTQVHRGEYFGSGDLFLAVSNRAGELHLGGYRFEQDVVPADGVLVARVALGAGGQHQRSLSSLPTGQGCIARGFGYTDNGDGSASFYWTFHSSGDYDQNGEVNISDLTPIGVNFGKQDTAGDWAAAALADGDENGEVNISDVTPIGMYYGTELSGYKLERSATAGGSYSAVASLPLSSAVASPALAFSYVDAAAASGTWYRVRAYSDADPSAGAATAALQISLQPQGDAPVPDFSFAPASPLTGQSVAFTDLSSGGPSSWSWDFDDGSTSTLRNPSHIFAVAATYTVSLTASNANGSRQASYLVVVTQAPVTDDVAETFVAESSATLHEDGTAFDILSTDLPDGISILFGPLTQGMQPVDNHLSFQYPYRGGLNEPASPHPDIRKKLGSIGITVSGIVIYGPSNASTITRNGSTWSYDANSAKINGEDAYGGHASQVNSGQYHYHDVAFITNNSWVGVPGFLGSYTHGDGHSRLIGWAEDGYPIYGPWGYVDPLDPTSGVAKMTPGWESTNTGANRPPAVITTADGAVTNSRYIVCAADPGGLGINPGMRLTEVNGVAPAGEVYILNQQNITYVGGGHPPYTGPTDGVEMNMNVDIPGSATLRFEFLPGCFIEDNVYVGGGTLDRYNGRFGITPDYPGGTYAYFCTMAADGDGLYPYMIGPELYGSNVVGGTPGSGYVKPAD